MLASAPTRRAKVPNKTPWLIPLSDPATKLPCRDGWLMIGNPTREALAAHLAERGIHTLRDAGVACALSGQSSIEEVARVVNG